MGKIKTNDEADAISMKSTMITIQASFFVDRTTGELYGTNHQEYQQIFHVLLPYLWEVIVTVGTIERRLRWVWRYNWQGQSQEFPLLRMCKISGPQNIAVEQRPSQPGKYVFQMSEDAKPSILRVEVSRSTMASCSVSMAADN